MNEYYILNMNQSVQVRLTELGYQRLAEKHNEYIGVIPNWDLRTPDFYKNLADKDGYSRFQFWTFMSDFGEVTGMAKPQYFHLEIKIKAENLWPVIYEKPNKL